MSTYISIQLPNFDSAHQLPYHKGKCSNVHGHTYKVEVEVGSSIQKVDPDNSESGMVIDFSILKEIYKPLHTLLDHSYLTGTILPEWLKRVEGFDIEWVDTNARYDIPGFGAVSCLSIPVTTAEYLAHWIFSKMEEGLHKYELETGVHILLYAVRVWETPNSYAEAI